MTGNLEQLDPNYVVSFEYSKGNVGKLVSEFEKYGLPTITRPGHNTKTVYAFTRVEEPGVFEGDEAFSEKHAEKPEKPGNEKEAGAGAGARHAEKKPIAATNAPDLDRNIDVPKGPSSSDSKEEQGQGFLSKAQDTVKNQGGVQGLKDKAGKIPGSDKAEESLKKNIPGGSSGGGEKKGLADQAKGGLKGFNKDDVIKGGKDVLTSHQDEIMSAGEKAAKGDTSALKDTGVNVGKDVAGRVDKDQLISGGKKAFSGDKKDILKSGKKAIGKNQAEGKAKDMLSGAAGIGGAAGAAGAAGGGDATGSEESAAADSNVPSAAGTPSALSGGDKPSGKALKKDVDLQSTTGSFRSDAAVKGLPREPSASPVPHGKPEEPEAAAAADVNAADDKKLPAAPPSDLGGGGGRATLFAIVANFDFVHSVTPIYDSEKRKKLDSTIQGLIEAPALSVPTDRDLINLEHLTRNPREILYFYYFKNYILWLLPLSVAGVGCRLFSRIFSSWEFNLSYTFFLIGWSLLFTSSWIYYFEPRFASRLGRVLNVLTSDEEKLSAPSVVLYKKFAFVPVALLFAASLVAFQFLCFFIEIFITQLYSGPFSAILALLPTVLITAAVPVFNLVYNKVFVDPLVKWENGPDPRKSKTEKNYVLTFLTSYVPLFITLFVYLPLGHSFASGMQSSVTSYAEKYNIPVIASDFIVDIDRYKKQFFYYTVTAQIINMIMENIVPLVLDVLVPSVVRDGTRFQSDVVAKIDSVVQSRYPQDFDLWKEVQLHHATNYGEFDVDQNYSKLVVQFGYIALFSIIWPLAPLIFTIFDAIIFRADLWRAFIKSKPSSNPTELQVAKGGGHKIHVSASPWNGILEKTTHLGFVVSVTLLLMYRNSNLPGVGLYAGLQKRATWYKESPLVLSWPKILLGAVIAEHLALLGYQYVRSVWLSYETKFEPATLPHVEVQANAAYDQTTEKEIDEIASVMEEVAYEPSVTEQPISKSGDAEIYGDRQAPSGDYGAATGFASDEHTRAAGYEAGYRAGYTKGSEDDDTAARGFDRGYENGYLNDDNVALTNGQTKDTGVGRSGSHSHRTGQTDGASREFGRHATSTKESNMSPPQVVPEAGPREIPVQSQDKSGLKSATGSGNRKAFGAAGAGAGAVGGTELASSDRSPSTKHHPDRESSYLENSTAGEDAGATLPDTIPTSKNYDSRYDQNGNPIRSATQSEASPSVSTGGDDGKIAGGAVGGGAAGGLGGLAAGTAGDLKSPKIPKEVGDLKSGNLPKSGGDIGKDVKKDIPKDVPKDLPKDIGSGFPSGNKPQASGASDTLRDTAEQGGKASGEKPSVGEAMKTLDPAAVSDSVGNIVKDPSSAPKEAGNLAQQGAPVASAVWANRSKGAKGAKGLDESVPSGKHEPSHGVAGEEGYGAGPLQGEKHAARGAENAEDRYAGGAAHEAEKPAHGKGAYGKSAQESPAAQQFGRDVHSLGSGKTFDTAESKVDNLTGAAAGPSEGAGNVGASGAEKMPKRSATKPRTETRPKSGAPSRSKTIGHSSQAKKEASNTPETPKGSSKDPKQRTSNPELRNKQADTTPQKGKHHKGGIFHKIIKKLE